MPRKSKPKSKKITSDTLLQDHFACIPFLMSFTAFGLIGAYLTIYWNNLPVNSDEGLPARIFQLLIFGQVPLIALFAFKWLPKAKIQAVQILTLQLIAVISALVFIYYIEL